MRTKPDRVLLVVVGAVVVLAVVTALFAATRSTRTYDRATPQGTVQAYLAASLDHDNAKAASFLASDSPCTVDDLDRAYLPDQTRVDLVSTQIDGDSAQVTVEVYYGSDSGPFGSPSAEQHTFRLARSGSTWLLNGIPWPLNDCVQVTK